MLRVHFHFVASRPRQGMASDLTQWSLVALLRFLCLIVFELARRFQIALPTSSEIPEPTDRPASSHTEIPYCTRACVFCRAPCIRREPGHKHHKRLDHLHIR